MRADPWLPSPPARPLRVRPPPAPRHAGRRKARLAAWRVYWKTSHPLALRRSQPSAPHLPGPSRLGVKSQTRLPKAGPRGAGPGRPSPRGGVSAEGAGPSRP